MDDFANILERDYGLKPQGKMAPMANVKPTPFSASVGNAFSGGISRNGSSRRSSVPTLADDDPFFGVNAVRSSSSSGRHSKSRGSDGPNVGFDDVFGGPPKFTPSPQTQPSAPSSSHNFEDILRPSFQKPSSATSTKGSLSYPVFDAPIYDDDIFGGMPGIRNADSAFENVFNLGSAAAAPVKGAASHDDLLGEFGSSDTKGTVNEKASIRSDVPYAGNTAFDDLLPGFGAAERAKPQSSEDLLQSKSSKAMDGSSASIMDSFAVFDSNNVRRTNHSTSASNAGFFDDPTSHSIRDNCNDVSNGTSDSSVNLLNTSPPNRPNLSKSSTAPRKSSPKESKSGLSQSLTHASESAASNDETFYHSTNGDNAVKHHRETPSSRVKLDGSKPASSAESASTGTRNKSKKGGEIDDSAKRSRQTVQEPTVSPINGGWEETPAELSKGGKNGCVDEFWISIDDVKLVTQPTEGPPPVRPPPVPGSRRGQSPRKPANLHDSKTTENDGQFPSDSAGSVLDDLEAFASGSSRMKDAEVDGTFLPPEEEQGSAAATASGAAMKEAIERAEAKLRQAKEAKDRDKGEASDTRFRDGRSAREREDGGETKAMHEEQEREREERDRESREIWHKEREEKDREKLRQKEREREREREKDRVNEMARQRAFVERANAEVREREAQKAAERASEVKAKAERVAVERATTEARERHGRTALEKARAAERAVAEHAEHEKAEKERAAPAAREQQGSTEDDLESFFKSTSRPTSAPKQRTNPTDGFPASHQTSRNSNAAFTAVKKVSSMPSMADDLTSLFGGPPAAGTFQEVEGEPADRRRARLERHQRTNDRANKALKEMHQRGLQSAKDQEERHRAGEIVDAEIKRWAAGKEGNLRALLSSLQYVLWPECGWQPVSLTDLITAAAVKKVYRKATLYVHPDKVQQKGATNQQKYIAEKVFDLLKEAWNKLNSEELF